MKKAKNKNLLIKIILSCFIGLAIVILISIVIGKLNAYAESKKPIVRKAVNSNYVLQVNNNAVNATTVFKVKN